MLLAIILPFLSLMTRGKVFAGILCLLLQLTFFGWLPAAIWAVSSLNRDRADKRNDELIAAMKSSR